MGGKRGRVKGEEKAEWLWVGKGEGCEIGGKSEGWKKGTGISDPHKK